MISSLRAPFCTVVALYRQILVYYIPLRKVEIAACYRRVRALGGQDYHPNNNGHNDKWPRIWGHFEKYRGSAP
jgi:hypothetical protein